MESIPASSSPAPAIRQLDVATLNRICGGQVVIDLSGAVKELVENALDAGATLIEVRLREFGAELLEVSDNGRGIPVPEHAGVTRKSWTSKIQSFEDVYRVQSFGFRGEALAALCELSSSLEITTRTKVDAAATHVCYGQDGSIRSRRPVARPVGTTVAVAGLFAPLPVRHREFIRSLRKQYVAMVSLLHSFAMVSRGVRFSVTNVPTGMSKDAEKRYSGVGGAGGAATVPAPAAGGARAAWQGVEPAAPAAKAGSSQRVLSTSGSVLLRDRVAELFGSEFLSSLCDLAVELPSAMAAARRGAALGSVGVGGASGHLTEPAAAAKASRDGAIEGPAGGGDAGGAAQAAGTAGVPAPAQTVQSRVTGLVSKAGTGVGRSNNEKQFFYLNGRPVDLPRVTKALNECWRAYEMGHKPAAILDFELPTGAYDINVSPDKRDVLLVDEGSLLDALKAALHALWEPSRRTFSVQSAAAQVDISGMLVQQLPKARPSGLASPAAPTAAPSVSFIGAASAVTPVARNEAEQCAPSGPVTGTVGLATECVIPSSERTSDTASAAPGSSAVRGHPSPPTLARERAPASAAGANPSVDIIACGGSAQSASRRATVEVSADTESLFLCPQEAVSFPADITPLDDQFVSTLARAAPDGSVGGTADADAGVQESSTNCAQRTNDTKRRRSLRSSHASDLSPAVGASALATGKEAATAGPDVEVLDSSWMLAWYRSPLSSRTHFLSRDGSGGSLFGREYSAPCVNSVGTEAAPVRGTTSPRCEHAPDAQVAAPELLQSGAEILQNAAAAEDDAHAAPLISDVPGVASAAGATALSLAACADAAEDQTARAELEREYTRVLHKPHFVVMAQSSSCVGQYNKGFSESTIHPPPLPPAFTHIAPLVSSPHLL